VFGRLAGFETWWARVLGLGISDVAAFLSVPKDGDNAAPCGIRRDIFGRRAFAAGLLLITLFWPLLAAAEPGVSASAIRFGQSAALQGPASALGRSMRDGLRAAFEEVNRSGGVTGRRLELVTYDDGYEPERAIANTLRLIDDDQVFALVGEVGTPTSAAAQPIATNAGVPFIGPLTGAEFLRDPGLPNVVNIRASYMQETQAWIDYLAGTLGMTRIAILYQDDSFGRAGLAGVTAALDKRGLGLVAEGHYRRNTTAVKRALLAIRAAKPEAVVIVGAYEPAAEFIKLARSIGPDAVFLNISFVGSRALAEALGEDGQGVLVSQVVPQPDDRTIPVVARYLDALDALDDGAEPGFVSLEGYLVGRLVVEAVRRLGSDVTREGFLATVSELGDVSIDGIAMSFGPGDNQGMDQVYITEIQSDGTFRSVDALTMR
jgi:ABC-type branched-subunit amino acid transport system substrate-binding protein